MITMTYFHTTTLGNADSVTRFGKISQLWHNFKLFGPCLRVYSVFGKKLNLLWLISLLFGPFSLFWMVQNCTKNLAIRSRCNSERRSSRSRRVSCCFWDFYEQKANHEKTVDWAFFKLTLTRQPFCEPQIHIITATLFSLFR